MNERYLYRGKRKDNGEWVTGYLIKGNNTYIVTPEAIYYMVVSISYMASVEFVEVIPETVGQCTGLRDKNGEWIFEGDILKGFHYPFLSDGDHNYYAVVVRFDDCPAFGIYTVKNPTASVRGISTGDTDFMEDWEPNDWKIIGKKWDNPELLEVSE